MSRPNVPNAAITLMAADGQIVGFANPELMTQRQLTAFATQGLRHQRTVQLQELQIPQTYTGMQEGRRRNVYNIMYILFAVLIGIVIDFLSGSHFLRFIGVVKGSVSPFVSSIASASPFASSIGTVSPISSDW